MPKYLKQFMFTIYSDLEFYAVKIKRKIMKDYKREEFCFRSSIVLEQKRRKIRTYDLLKESWRAELTSIRFTDSLWSSSNQNAPDGRFLPSAEMFILTTWVGAIYFNTSTSMSWPIPGQEEQGSIKLNQMTLTQRQ